MRLPDYLDGRPDRKAALLGALDCHPQMLWHWCREPGATGHRQVPVERAPAIERATNGDVTCEELRADVAWERVSDKAWPHPKGRPCLDIAAAA